MKRAPFIVAAVLAAAGIAVSLLLVRQHAAAHAGLASACNLGEFVNCDRVATSRWSVFLGIPVAVWGLLGYGLLLALALQGLARRRPHGTWPAGLLFAGSALAAAVSVGLALLSELVIGALCLYCAGSWLITFALLFVAWRACSPDGVAAALRGDAGVLARRPLLTAATAVLMAALVALTARAQPRYWERPAPSSGTRAPAQARAPADGPTVVVEFSDYECPFCAKAHDELKALLVSRPDVRVVKRHFPLDPSCNPLLTRPMHPRACALALAAICAERQGRFAEMDDALFANQQAQRPVKELAARIGLDVAAFEACLTDPEAARRLSSDVATGIQIGLKATPTYLVNGARYEGTLPPGALPPP